MKQYLCLHPSVRSSTQIVGGYKILQQFCIILGGVIGATMFYNSLYTLTTYHILVSQLVQVLHSTVVPVSSVPVAKCVTRTQQEFQTISRFMIYFKEVSHKDPYHHIFTLWSNIIHISKFDYTLFMKYIFVYALWIF